jgi:hypothetical protein
MDRTHISIPESNETGRPWEWFDPDRFYGTVVVLVGLSQLTLAFALPLDGPAWSFVVGGGGALLVAIGSNLFRGNAPFESGWDEDGEPGFISVTVMCLATLAVVVASVAAVLP